MVGGVHRLEVGEREGYVEHVLVERAREVARELLAVGERLAHKAPRKAKVVAEGDAAVGLDDGRGGRLEGLRVVGDRGEEGEVGVADLLGHDLVPLARHAACTASCC